MLIKNVRNKDKIAIIKCKSPFGLMFKYKLKTPIYFSFKKRHEGVHMFFVFFPIDVLWILNNKIVMKKTMMPFSTSKLYLCDTIIEAKEGRFKDWKVGDVVEFRN